MMSSTIGIIGGADGPTTVFVTGGFPWEILLLAGLTIGVMIWFKNRNK